MNDMIKRKDTKHMIVPSVVWEGLIFGISPYPIIFFFKGIITGHVMMNMSRFQILYI